MTALVEIYRGTWVNPKHVTAIITAPNMTFVVTQTGPSQNGWRVSVMCGTCAVTGWEFDNREDADAWANEITGLINRVLPGKEAP